MMTTVMMPTMNQNVPGMGETAAGITQAGTIGVRIANAWIPSSPSALIPLS